MGTVAPAAPGSALFLGLFLVLFLALSLIPGFVPRSWPCPSFLALPHSPTFLCLAVDSTWAVTLWNSFWIFPSSPVFLEDFFSFPVPVPVSQAQAVGLVLPFPR